MKGKKIRKEEIFRRDELKRITVKEREDHTEKRIKRNEEGESIQDVDGGKRSSRKKIAVKKRR